MTPDWLPRSLELLQRILEVPALAIWYVDWQADALVNAGAIGLPEAFIRELERASRGRASTVVHAVLDSLLVPVDMRETTQDKRVLTAAETRRHLGLEAGVVVPIRHAGRIVGLLSIYLARLDDFRRSDLQLYDSAAAALAVAWKIADTRRAILQNQLLYRTLVEEEPIGVLLCSVDGTVRLANGAAARLLGYERPDRLLGLRLPESVRTLAPLPWDEWVQRPIGAVPLERVIPVLSFDKRLRIIEFHARVVELPGEEPLYESSGRGEHHHFRCRGCGSILDLPGALLRVPAGTLLPGGHRVEECSLLLSGSCGECLSREGRTRGPGG